MRAVRPLVRPLGARDAGSAYDRVAEALGAPAVSAALAGLASAVRDIGLATDSALVGELLKDGEKERKDLSRDEYDLHRDWGLALLCRFHRYFSEGGFLIEQLALSGTAPKQVGAGEAPDRMRARFEAKLAKSAPNLRILTYTGSGSDAVNAVYEIARICGERRLARSRMPNTGASGQRSPGVAFFSRSYGGGRGPSREMNLNGWPDLRRGGASPYRLWAPNLDGNAPTESRVQEVEALEEQALRRIRELAASTETPLGAIVIEVVQGPGGVLTFRADFLRRLRALADELELPLIADEVLTCGGRTGRFFSYEHFDFIPDYVTFAKGLQVNGIAVVTRQGQKESQRVESLGDDFGVAHPIDYLKGERVLQALEDDRLIERATEVGRIVSTLLATIQEWHGKPREVGVAGAMLNWRRPPEITYLALNEPISPIPFGETAPMVRERMQVALDITTGALGRMFWVASRWQHVGAGVPPLELLMNVLGEPPDLREELANLEPVRGEEHDAVQVALATLAVKGGLPRDALAPQLGSVVEQLLQTGENLSPTRSTEVLTYRTVQAVGMEPVRKALEALAAAVAVGVARPSTTWARSGAKVPLIHPCHPAFRRGTFALGALLDAGQNYSLFRGDSPSGARARFETVLKAAVPNLRPVEPANDPSEAIRLMFELARELGLRRLGVSEIDALGGREPKPAFFWGGRGAGRGPGAALRSEALARSAGAEPLSTYALPDPTFRPGDASSLQAMSRVEEAERAALERIRQLASDPEHPLGAIYLEPVRTERELRFHRPEFLRNLRALANELKIAIIADELDTAGGRAGSFFAFQRTELVPDYVVYGGLPQCGVAFIERAGNDSLRIKNLGMTTAGGTAADYHASAEILRVVTEEHLWKRALRAERAARQEGLPAFGALVERAGEVVTQPLDTLPPCPD
ncbi:aminotransferase class III-fold pyridoxal phosphate-dependent enzyme [Hyalangium gracile]|uniref:aminotransferase class III-fold pyridoxal phosphate-dependent enzyme n=1 Tax=Hyalangium gracile TaxID=394092 RepID=UPI001CCAD6B5|nr:aminotransferase class III-fold pyridoxal phosphate-dependent enzyme [Hyalangium gracile]